jgi:hypothetical protein
VNLMALGFTTRPGVFRQMKNEPKFSRFCLLFFRADLSTAGRRGEQTERGTATLDPAAEANESFLRVTGGSRLTMCRRGRLLQRTDPSPRGQVRVTLNRPLTVTRIIALATPELPEIDGSHCSNGGGT